MGDNGNDKEPEVRCNGRTDVILILLGLLVFFTVVLPIILYILDLLV